MMTILNFGAVIVSHILLATMLWGYRGSLSRRSNRAAHFMAWAILLLALKYIARGLVWDVALPIMEWMGRPDLVTVMRTNRAEINFVFTVTVIAAAICAHMSLYWSIPTRDRWRWSRWTAWRHPKGGRRPLDDT